MTKKEKMKSRRKMYDQIAQIQRATYRATKSSLKLEPGKFRVTFSFSPEEMGINPSPTPEAIEKLGIVRATERVNRYDFFTEVSIIAKGGPNKDNLAAIRSRVLESTLRKNQSSALDLSQFITTAGEANETESGTVVATEI